MIKKNLMHEAIINHTDDYIFNILDIENFNSDNSRLRFWFEHCKKNIDKIEGDIFEFGVFKGSSLISIAMLLKKIGSDKKVYGFDSFSGFPPYHPNDSLNAFESNPKIFDEEHIKKHKLLMNITSIKKKDISPLNISSAGNFSDTTEESVRKRINDFELDNIELVVGEYSKTIPFFFKTYKGIIFSCNMDCDLYLSYKQALPFVYKKMTDGSFIHLDEYYSLKFPGARIACVEFFKKMNINPSKCIVPANEFERWCLIK